MVPSKLDDDCCESFRVFFLSLKEMTGQFSACDMLSLSVT